MHLGSSWIEIVWACFRYREPWNAWNTYILYPDDLFGWLKVIAFPYPLPTDTSASAIWQFWLIDSLVFWLTFIQHNQKNLLCELALSERATLIDRHEGEQSTPLLSNGKLPRIPETLRIGRQVEIEASFRGFATKKLACVWGTAWAEHLREQSNLVGERNATTCGAGVVEMHRF